MPMIIALAICIGVGFAIQDRLPFTEIRRPLFAFTVPLVVVGGVFFNIWLVDTLIPDLLDAYNQAHEEYNQLREAGVRRRFAHAQAGDSVLGMLVKLPLALVFAGLWFWLFKHWERKAATS